MKKIIYGMLVLILMSHAYALGVSPAHRDVFFEKNTAKTVSVLLVNNEQKDMDIVVTKKNKMAPYLRVPEEIIHISSEEYTKEVSYEIVMPEKLSPGTHPGDVVFVELNDASDRENIVGTSLGVVHQARIMVPYPDQYLQGTLYVPEISIGDPTVFTVSLMNLGSRTIEDIQGTVIITQEEVGVAQISTSSLSLEPKEKGKVTATWNTDISAGRYDVQAFLKYDDKVLILNREIDVGEPLLEIEDLRTYPFDLGSIAKMDVILHSKWNQYVTNIYSDVTVRDTQENIVMEFESAKVDIPPHGQGENSIYWDTQDVEEGEYIIDVRTNYMGRFAERVFETIVDQEGITIKGQATGQVVGSSNTKTIGISGLVILVLIAIIAKLVWDRKKPRKVKEVSDPELRNFIRKRFKEGYTAKSIRDNLRKKGWNRDVIDSEMMRIEDEMEN